MNGIAAIGEPESFAGLAVTDRDGITTPLPARYDGASASSC